MKSWKRLVSLVLAALACAAVLTFLAQTALYQADQTASDAFYFSPRAFDGDIVLIGIDQRAIDELGPYSQWGREVMATALEKLNGEENCRPAVIGVDVLYTGQSGPADETLAQAAGRYGNVVVACAAQVGSGLARDRAGEYYMEPFSILSLEQPYEQLRRSAGTAHINAMLDRDGILRHHLLYLDLPGGERLNSMALELANRYRAYRGREAVALPPTDARGFWYLPYVGLPGALDEKLSIAGLLAGEYDPARFAGKIVLIGPYAPALQDGYLTSADHARQMYGVEIQANAVQALLWENDQREVPSRVQLPALFALLLLAFAAFWKRPVAVSTAVWLGLSGLWLLVCRIAYRQGYVLHVLWLPATVTALYVGCIAANYIRSVLERRRVTQVLGRHVDPKIVDEILKEGADRLNLEGEAVDIAVLFVDLRSFTTLSEKLADPKKVVNILNSYLTLISSCVWDNGGTLDKFVGDAVMAFWGAPTATEDFTFKAVRAAMDMVERRPELLRELEQTMPEVLRELREKFDYEISYGVGVHLGKAVVGNIGSDRRRMDYTAIGDTVNTAARLEANAPGGTVYISRAVADALEGRIAATSLGDSVKLKGKTDFEVLTLDAILPPSDTQP